MSKCTCKNEDGSQSHLCLGCCEYAKDYQRSFKIIESKLIDFECESMNLNIKLNQIYCDFEHKIKTASKTVDQVIEECITEAFLKGYKRGYSEGQDDY